MSCTLPVSLFLVIAFLYCLSRHTTSFLPRLNAYKLTALPLAPLQFYYSCRWSTAFTFAYSWRCPKCFQPYDLLPQPLITVRTQQKPISYALLTCTTPAHASPTHPPVSTLAALRIIHPPSHAPAGSIYIAAFQQQGAVATVSLTTLLLPRLSGLGVNIQWFSPLVVKILPKSHKRVPNHTKSTWKHTIVSKVNIWETMSPTKLNGTAMFIHFE